MLSVRQYLPLSEIWVRVTHLHHFRLYLLRDRKLNAPCFRMKLSTEQQLEEKASGMHWFLDGSSRPSRTLHGA